MKKFYFRAMFEFDVWQYSEVMNIERVKSILKRVTDEESYKFCSATRYELMIVGEESPYIVLW